MYVHALCVSCKEITTRNHCGIRREFLARIMAIGKLYTRLARRVENCHAWEGQDYREPMQLRTVIGNTDTDPCVH